MEKNLKKGDNVNIVNMGSRVWRKELEGYGSSFDDVRILKSH